MVDAAADSEVQSNNSGTSESKSQEKSETPAWRHSPFASAEIGIAAKAPEFVLNLAHAMEWNPRKDDRYLIGQLLASAVMHGALLHEAAWPAWLQGLIRLQEEGELLWVDMHIRDDDAMYRWFADPTTRILIHKWRGLKRAAQKHSARDCLKHFLSELPGAHESDDTVSLFLDWAVVHWRLRLPPLLLDQALCRLPTVTMSHEVWLQVIGKTPDLNAEDLVPYDAQWVKRPRSTFDASQEWIDEFDDKGSIESQIFKEASRLRRMGVLTRFKEKNFCVMRLKAALPNLSDGRQLLAGWAIARLTQTRPRPNPKGFAPSTVRQRLCAILEGVYPDIYEQEDFLVSLEKLNKDVETKVAGGIETTQKRLIQEAHKDLCRHMRDLSAVKGKEGEEYELEPQIGDDPQAPVFGRPIVSAKILTPKMFDAAVQRARLRKNEQAALIIILAFRTGLRFREIAGLRIHDFITNEKDIFELHVERNRHRELKTFDSRRILPLDILMTTEEQFSLHKWLKRRREQALHSCRNVFCFGPVMSSSPIPDSQAWIELLLNEECEDSGASEKRNYAYNFAHLRHSFGSYLLASLLLPEDTDRTLVPEAFKDVVCWERKKILSTRLLGEERLGQAALHAVSQIMGHTGIYRTLESYQHLLDLVVGLYVSRRALQPFFPPAVHASLEVSAESGDVDVDVNVDVMEIFCRQRKSVGRSSLPSKDYKAPYPPERLSVPARQSDWKRLDLGRASSLYGLPTPHRSLETCRRPVGPWGSPMWEARAVHPDWGPKLDWITVWTIVTSRKEEAEKLRQSISLGKETYDEWCKRYQKVLNWGFKRQTNRRSEEGALPLPLGAQALSEVNWMWIRRTAKRIPRERRPLIRTFLSNFNANRFYSRFPSMDLAVEFAAFLRDVGVDGRNITIAQGSARDLQALKSGQKATHEHKAGDTILYRTRAASEAFLPKPHTDLHPAFWISHIKHEEGGLGRSFDITRDRGHSSPFGTGRRTVHNGVNYAYRFVLAMMAIVDDAVWDEPPEPVVGNGQD